MGKRLPITIAIVIAIATPAISAEFVACWTTEVDTGFGNKETITRCRISGGDSVDYASDSDVPSTLYPNLGTDLVGQCWYLTSAVTEYLVITQYADGTADIAYDPDLSTPGGIIVVGPNMPRCTSEPTPATSPSADAWDYVTSYLHDPPTPDLNPVPGQGVTGLATYIGVVVPEDHAATITSGVSALDVEIDVDAVTVSWGDGATDTFPPDGAILAGYPDGTATHVYESKNVDGVPLTVEYDWTARWRVAGGSWLPLDVPNTGTTVTYPIAEVVSRLDS
jgi:hypothetical protein